MMVYPGCRGQYQVLSSGREGENRGLAGGPGGREEGRLDAVYRLPYRVPDVVRARGGGVRGFGDSPGYRFGGEGSVVLVVREAEKRGRWGFGRKKVVKKRLCYRGRIGDTW